MKNLKEVAEMISLKRDNVVLFADADLDGVCSAIILKKSIEAIGGSVSVYISNTDKWGRGLAPETVSYIKEKPPALLVTLDCGMTNFEGVLAAKEAGFDVVVIDHHEELDRLPKADLILNPKQKNDNYPFKGLANVGVVYFLTKEILGEKFSLFRRSFLEATTLATIADMVPQKEDNKKIIDEGVSLLENPQIPALRILKQKTKEDFIQKTISLLNITDFRGDVNLSFLFLSSKNETEAEKMLKDLFQAREAREEEIKNKVEKVLQETSEKDVIVFYKGDIPFNFCGSVASHVVGKVKKPAFICSQKEGVVRGSVRVSSKLDAVEAMTSCSESLLSFGGHAPAAGFALKEENVDDFKKCLIDYFKNK